MGEWVYREARRPQPGNKLAVTHGTQSAELVAARAEEIRVELGRRFEFLGDPVFGEAFERYCQAQARALMLSEYIWDVVEGRQESRPERRGAATTGVGGVPKHLWTELARAESNAQKFGQELGLDPTGFARIAKELGWAKQLSGSRVSDLMSKGRELRRGSE